MIFTPIMAKSDVNADLLLAYLKLRVDTRADEISARELGKLAKVSEVTIHHIREGKRGIGPRSFYKLVRALNETPASIEEKARAWAEQNPAAVQASSQEIAIPAEYPAPLRRWLTEHAEQNPIAPEVAAVSAQMRANPDSIPKDAIGPKLEQVRQALGLVGIVPSKKYEPQQPQQKTPRKPKTRVTGLRLTKAGMRAKKKHTGSE